jgi:hypothetical protein
MRILNAIFRNVTMLNLLLLAILVLSVDYAVLPYLNVSVKVAVPSARAVETEQAESAQAGGMQSQPNYLMVAEENLFHPERRIPPEKKAEQVLPKPELTLYGTAIAEGIKVAFVEDGKAPVTTPGRGKRQTVLKEGDAIGGFVLREIQPDKITLVKGEEKMVVNLLDLKKNRSSETTTGGPPSGPAAAPLAGPRGSAAVLPAQPVPVETRAPPAAPGSTTRPMRTPVGGSRR